MGLRGADVRRGEACAVAGGRLVRLEAGDVLLVPPQWWHDVRCESDIAVSINQWLPLERLDAEARLREALVRGGPQVGVAMLLLRELCCAGCHLKGNGPRRPPRLRSCTRSGRCTAPAAARAWHGRSWTRFFFPRRCGCTRLAVGPIQAARGVLGSPPHPLDP